MNRRLLEDLHRYFSRKQNPSKEEQNLLMQLEGEMPFFQITGLHRDDLEGAGFDSSQVTDSTMEHLAGRMADDYCEQMFAMSMSVIAGMCFDIPEKQ